MVRREACDLTVAGTSHLPERLCSLLAFALFQGFCPESGCALCFRSKLTSGLPARALARGWQSVGPGARASASSLLTHLMLTSFFF